MKARLLSLFLASLGVVTFASAALAVTDIDAAVRPDGAGSPEQQVYTVPSGEDSEGTVVVYSSGSSSEEPVDVFED